MIFKIVLLTISLSLSLFSCGGGYWWNSEDVEFHFLDNKDNLYLQYSNDLSSASTYNDIIYKYSIKNKKENLKEWQVALENRFSIKELEDIIYKNRNQELILDEEFQEYLKFIKEQEYCVTYNPYINQDFTYCKDFIPIALNKIDNTKNSFLKQRYFYIALRLSHYKDSTKNSLDIYNKYSYLLNNSNSIVKDWIQGLYAGALVRNNEIAKGVYEFSKLFENSINSHLSFYNFKYITSEEYFNELLSYAKDDSEKTKMYAIRALNYNSNVLEEMKNIYNIDKNSKWLDFLIFRELLKSQTLHNTYGSAYKDYENENSEYIDFLKNIDKDDRYLVDLSLVHFNIYFKKYEESKKILDRLLVEFPNKHELEVASYILYLNSLKSIDSSIEDEIYKRVSHFNENEFDIYKYTLNTLSNLYKNQNQDFEKYLSDNFYYIEYKDLDLENFKKFEMFLETKQNTKLREFLQTKFKKMVTANKSSFDFAKITVLINNLKFKEALDTNFEILDKTKVEFNPFNGLIKGNNRSGKKEPFTIREFLQRVIKIENELEKNPNSVMDNFLLANSLYNLSHFGNINRVTTVYRSNYLVHTPKLQEQKLNLAINYYEKALENSKDIELNAKITYLIAKTKLALFDLNYDKYPQENNWWKKNSVYNYGSDEFYEKFLENSGSRYFNILQNNFKDTRYYNELIQECGDFKTYINRDNKG
ncbi:MAG: hypothetical protein PHS78_03390 [Aliarcobacter skirrowii]|uniref:hypothetical protein n=1 Tax=Aliarcobacter skirrowii TaxID=28200 RepID=UPI0024300ABF|nr:hypothetical protein [Aliarcobacter skirrowii]MDD2508063.1 hypothetical protein [Aliarcobacter skirrowii]MDD3496249.1 hypothetical protein [Aliarcobacter skirrowii]